MSYEDRYKLLEPDIVRYVVFGENPTSKELFMDCLAAFQLLLGDLLYPVGTVSHVSRTIVKNLFENALVQLQAHIENPGVRDSVVANIQTNMNTALALFTAWDHQSASTDDLRQRINNFLGLVLEQYAFFRHPNEKSFSDDEKSLAAGGAS